MSFKGWIRRWQSRADLHRRKRDRKSQQALREQILFQPMLARLEDRRVLSVSVGVDAGVVTFQGEDGASDALSLSASSGGCLQYSSDGGKTWTTDLDSGPSEVELLVHDIARVRFFGGGGDDTLTVDFRQGSPIPVEGLLFDGGGDHDSLRIVGSGLHAIYSPNAVLPGSGLISLSGGAISFADLEPIDYEVAGGTFTLNLPGGDDLVDIADSTLTDGITPALKISGSSGGVSFEDARVRGSTIVIDTTAVAGADRITISSAAGSHANTSLRIATGVEAGDVVTVNGTATFSGTVTIDCPTVNLSAPITNRVAGTATTVNVASPGRIQDGIDAAVNHGTIHVAAGNYSENLTINRDYLTVRSTDGAASTIITPSDTTAGGVFIQGDYNTFEGFTVQDFTDDSRENKIIRIGIGSDYNTIQDNVLQGNLNQSGIADPTEYGVLCYGSYNIIQGNQIHDLGYIAVNVVGSPHSPASENLIQGNALYDIGIYAIALDRSPGNTLSRNAISDLVGGTLWGDFYDPAVWCWGIIVWGEAADGNLITDQTLSGLPNGISLSSAHHTVIEDSAISGNSGVGVRISKSSWAGGIPTGNVVRNSFIENNQVGILILGATGDVGPGNIAHDNRIAGNSTANVENASGLLIDASVNWWGTSDPAFVADTVLGLVDYTPWLDTGTDLDLAAPGFQPDRARLHVDDDSPQSSTAAGGRISEAIGALPASGGTVWVHAGTYTEDVDAATTGRNVTLSADSGPCQVAIDGDLTLDGGDTLAIEVHGPSPADGYDNLIVRGQVALGGATLQASRLTSFVPDNETAFTLIDNDLDDPVIGTFDALDEGDIVTIGGIPFSISYKGGTGNDVVLTIVTPTDVYVDDTWAGTPIGTTPLTSDPACLIFQYNAFAEIQGAIDRVAAGGTVAVYGGIYSDAVDLNKTLDPIRIATNPNIPSETVVDLAGAVTLDVDTTFQQYGATILTFSSTIDADADADSESLVLNGPNTTTFAGRVGALVALGSIITDPAGTTTINTDAIRGDVLEFNDAVILGADTVLTGASSVTFNGTVDGDGNGVWDLTIDAGAGDVLFGDAVGASGGLGAITVVGARDVTAQSSVQAASLVQESGVGTTRFDGLVSVTGFNGIDLTTQLVIFNDQVKTADANGPLVVAAAQDIRINDLIRTGGGAVELIAGGDVTMSSSGLITTDDAPVKIAAEGSLVMLAGALVETGEGPIRVTADGGIAVGRLVSETLVALTSADGAIRDAGDAGGADVESPRLVLRAGQGIGPVDPLDTRVQTLAVGNTDSGDVQIVNDGPLTIGTVDGLAGISNGGGGDLSITNHGAILVSDPVLNLGGGDTMLVATGGTLTVKAPIACGVEGHSDGGSITLRADGDVVIQADVVTNGGQRKEDNAGDGLIVVDAGGKISLATGVTIRTGSGQMQGVSSPDEPTSTPPPVSVQLIPVDQGGSNVDSQGYAIIEVTVTDPAVMNYQVRIDWADGYDVWDGDDVVTYPAATSVNEPRTFGGFQTGLVYRFDYSYMGKGNPNALNPSAPIPVSVTVAYDGRANGNGVSFNGIVFREGGEFLSTTVSGELTVPGTGLFATIKVVKSEIVPVALRHETGAAPIITQVSSGSQQATSYEPPARQLEFTSYAALRIFFRRVDTAGQEGEDVELPPELLEGGLFAVFQRFPNGRYRIYLREANSDRERMIQEVNVFQGRIVPPDFRDSASERQMGDESQKPSEQRPADEPKLEDEARRAEKPPVAKPPLPKAERSAAGGMSAQPAASTAAAGGAAGTLGWAVGGGVQRWAEQVDRAFHAGRRSLSRTARLARRLRREKPERRRLRD